MEHRLLWEKSLGSCRIKACSCGERYLVIGRACLKMTEKLLGDLAGLMGDWRREKDDRSLLPVLTAAQMEPWAGPAMEKEPCFN